MFPAEAKYLAQQLEAMDGPLSPVLNIGSSGEVFRTRESPWIDQFLFEPLRGRGVRIVHVDVTAVAGVDLTADIMSDDGYALMARVRPQTILLCNVLEHVLDPEAFARRAFDLLEPGGRLLITVPRSYPHHRAPIDTMFRPLPEEVAALAPQARMVHGAVLATSSYWQDVKKRPWILLRQILRAPFPFLGWSRYKRTMRKLYWLVNPYRVTIVVLEKSAAPAPAPPPPARIVAPVMA